MVSFLSLVLHVLISPFKSRTRLEAEIILLRHQLNVLRRRTPPKPRLTVADRLIFVWLFRLFPSVLSAVTIIQPDTIIRGAQRIHGELLKLGIEVAQSTVAKYLATRGGGSSQTWKTFLRNHAAGIAAMDFLIAPTVSFPLLFVLVILRHQRRRLISLSVTGSPTAERIAHQITDAFPWNEAPNILIRDRDGSYGHAVTRRLAHMGIRDHPTAPRSPWQNGHPERLIGSIRRECLDHIVVFGEAHLRRILAAYATYYNDVRTHLALGKDAPARRPIQRFGEIAVRPILGGLHHEYCRM
jgi:transposase InsO family protein